MKDNKGHVKTPLAKKIILPLLLLAGILGTVAALTLGGGNKTLTLSGTLEGDEYGVIAEAGGKILAVSVNEGDTLAEGSVIAEIDGEMQRLQVEQQEESLKAKQAKLKELIAGARKEELVQARIRVENAAVDVAYWEDQTKRLKRLYNDHNIPESKYLEALHKYNLATGKLQEARAGLTLLEKGPREETIEAMEAEIAAAEKAIAQGKLSLEKHKVAAPVEGRLTLLTIQKGDMVSFGQRIGKITQSRPLHFRIYLPGTYLHRVSPGQRITAYPYGQETLRFAAVVDTIASEAEFTPKNTETPEAKEDRVFKVTLEMAPPTGGTQEKTAPGTSSDKNWGMLKPGITMIAEIPPAAEENSAGEKGVQGQ